MIQKNKIKKENRKIEDKKLEIFLNKLKKNKKINSVILFGSQITKKTTKFSDVDICIFGNIDDYKKQLKIFIMKPSENYDISFFEELPIWIKIRVFREGKILFVKDKKMLYERLFRTIREYEDFLPLIKRRVVEKFGTWQI